MESRKTTSKKEPKVVGETKSWDCGGEEEEEEEGGGK